VNSKSQMASVSLIGAIPGLALSIVLVIALVRYFPMTIMTGSLAGLTLLVSVGLAMLPVVIMVFGSKTVNDTSEVDEEQSEDAAKEKEKEEELVAANDEEVFELDEDAADETDDDFDEAEDEEEFDMGLFEDEDEE
jgi:uncharacterized membrane protein